MTLEDDVYNCIKENNGKYTVKDIAEILKHERVFDIEMIASRLFLNGIIEDYYYTDSKLSMRQKLNEIKFKDLSTEDKAIICNLMRMRCENVYAEIEDFEGLSNEGLEYYKKLLVESLPDEFKN